MTNKKQEDVKKLFDTISAQYDKNNDIISFGTHKYAKKHSIEILNLKSGYKILDLCTGTGDIAGFIKQKCPECTVIGLDFAPKMLETARKKFSNVEFVEGDCTKLPFPNNSFDTITMSFGLRNIEDKDTVLKEISRVLKKGGEFMHLDFGKNNPAADFIYDKTVPVLIKIFYDNHDLYNHLIHSKQEFLKPAELIKKFEEHNFIFKCKKNYLLGMINAIVMTA